MFENIYVWLQIYLKGGSKMKKINIFFVGLVITCLTSFFTHSVFARDWAIPTPYEQLMLEMLNRDRADPDAAAVRYGVPDLNDNVSPGSTISNDPKQPLAFHLDIEVAAQYHSFWQIDTDTFSHTGILDTNPGERMWIFGYGDLGTFAWGENIGWSGIFPTLPEVEQFTRDLQRGLFRDEGQPEAGHRIIMMIPDYKEAGVGVWEGQFFSGGTNWNAVMVTQDFATKVIDNPLITGVVYYDLDSDNLYTPSEEIFPVVVAAISQTTGDIFLTTAPFSPLNLPTGGYAISVPADTYTVVAFAGALIDPVFQINVVVTTENVKVDLIPPTPLASSSPETSKKAKEFPSEVIIKLSEDPQTFFPE